MTTPKKYLPEYLSFTRKERTGSIAMLILIILFTVLPFLYPFFIKSSLVDHSAFEKEIAALHIKEQDSAVRFNKRNYSSDDHPDPPAAGNNYSRQTKAELFYFDPNTLAVAGWIKLGIREKTANTIKNYTAKGGRFSKPEDIAKIWGLHPDEVNRLFPYVRIEDKSANNYSPSKPFESYKIYEKPTYSIATVDINTADTAAFIALPGIGSKLANRIIAFREKLGGFYKVEQVAETFALADSTFQKIKDKLIISNNQVKQLNINKATLNELKTHPYIRYAMANAIIQYKAQHGDFTSVSDLKQIMVVTEELYSKLSPYITIK